MEQSLHEVQEVREDNRSYWASVLIGAIIFGIISAAIQLIIGYIAINGGGQSNWIGSVVCLIVGFAGIVAVWHYASEREVAVSLGKGALIGFLAGVLAQLIGFGLLEVWKWLDPHYVQALKQMKIAAIQNSQNIPDQYKQKAVDYINHPRGWYSALTIGISAFGVGIISLITGMIGAKLFSRA